METEPTLNSAWLRVSQTWSGSSGAASISRASSRRARAGMFASRRSESGESSSVRFTARR